MKEALNSLLLFLVTMLGCTSCTEGGPAVHEEIGIFPPELSVPSGLSIQKLDIEAKCQWTLAINDSIGGEVNWATQDKKAGEGSVTVNIRFTANPFKEDRTATLTVTSKGDKNASVSILQARNTDSEIDDRQFNVRIGTFNLRSETIKADQGTENQWSERKSRVFQSIKENDFDVFAVQECGTVIQDDLRAQFKETYTFGFFNPYNSKGGQNTSGKNESMGIIFKTDLFTMSDWHYFWPSANPETMSQNDTGSEGNFNRGACCCILTHKDTGMKIFVMSAHGFLNNEAGYQWCHVYADMEKKYNHESFPSFFIGDLNARSLEERPTEKDTEFYRTYWKDPYLVLPTNAITGPSGTYNGYSTAKYRLDYVYYKGAAEPQEYVCNTKKYDNKFASDHYPIYVDFIIKSTE